MKKSETIVGKVIGLMGPMRPMRLIGLMRPMGLMGLVGLVGACSSEQVPEPEAQIPLEVMPCMTPFEEEIAPTRAWQPPTGFSEIEGTETKKIGICFTQNGQEPKKGNFYYNSSKWYTSVENIEATTYYLYGYYPHVSDVTCDISSLATPGDNTSYSTGAVLTLRNQPSATPNDLCVVVGAKNGYNNGYNANADYTIGGLKRGDFAYAATAATTDTPPTAHGNYVFLLFDHLYSAVRFQFKVDNTYNSLRHIKLKKLELQAFAGDEQYPLKTEITVTLKATSDGIDPIESIVYTPTGTARKEDWSTFFTSTEGELVTTTYGTDKDCYFAPRDITKLILKSTYDIYDTNVTPEHPEGNLIRKNSEAENTIDINTLFFPEPEALRSKRYTVRLTIQPTYLYMMSDPDLDNPRLEVD